MAKRAKPTKAPRIKRNPLAKVLRTPKYRPRVVKQAGAYTRRPKHPEPPDDGN